MLALLRHGANVNAHDIDGRTPLHCVCNDVHEWVRTGRLREAVDLLLRWGADETARDEERWTPADILDSRRQKLAEEGGWPRRWLDEMERARSLLARGPADRVWCRRGWAVLLRSRASASTKGRRRGARGGDRSAAGKSEAVRIPHRAKEKDDVLGQSGVVSGGGGVAVEGQDSGGLAGVVAALLGTDDGVFRKVVGFV